MQVVKPQRQLPTDGEDTPAWRRALVSTEMLLNIGFVVVGCAILVRAW